MSDLVKRLRMPWASNTSASKQFVDRQRGEAADEIERLEKELSDLSFDNSILRSKNINLRNVLIPVLEIAERNETGNVTKRARKALEEVDDRPKGKSTQCVTGDA